MKKHLITVISLCVLITSCQHYNRSTETSSQDSLLLDTVVNNTIANNHNQPTKIDIPTAQLPEEEEIQKLSTDNINIEETYIRPGLMSSTDGRGGSTSTYFRLHGNQLEKINQEANFLETYTIIDKKSIGNDIYLTIRGNAQNSICQVVIKKEDNGANILMFIVPGEFDERYVGF